MKLKHEFVTNDVAGSTVAIPVGNENRAFNGYIRLNETGASIFNLLKEDVTKEQIVEALLNEYEGTSKEEVTKTVEDFLAKLSEAGII